MVIMPCEAKTVEAVGDRIEPNEPNKRTKEKPHQLGDASTGSRSYCESLCPDF